MLTLGVGKTKIIVQEGNLEPPAPQQHQQKSSQEINALTTVLVKGRGGPDPVVQLSAAVSHMMLPVGLAVHFLYCAFDGDRKHALLTLVSCGSFTYSICCDTV